MLGPGDRIGDYQILRELKSGGMATLFLGRREGPAGFARHVAVKAIHPHLAKDQVFVQMFLDEARLSARIQHPNVVHVEELGEQQGSFYLVMEYVHGCSLGQLLSALAYQQRALSPEMACYIATRVADGLHTAHETRGDDGELLGVVHRDISPDNVLLSTSGHVKLIDFGIAKARGRTAQTQTGSIRGKIRYMSPEQAWGRPFDRRADVYALGVVLWEMLTTRRLFTADNDFALLEEVRRPSAVPPSHHVPEIPSSLDEVVLRALSPDPQRRFVTTLEVKKAIVTAFPECLNLDASDLADLLAAVIHPVSVENGSDPGQVVLPHLPEASPRERGFSELTQEQKGAVIGALTRFAPDNRPDFTLRTETEVVLPEATDGARRTANRLPLFITAAAAVVVLVTLPLALGGKTASAPAADSISQPSAASIPPEPPAGPAGPLAAVEHPVIRPAAPVPGNTTPPSEGALPSTEPDPSAVPRSTSTSRTERSRRTVTSSNPHKRVKAPFLNKSPF